MKWFKIVVPDEEVAEGMLDRISNAFEFVLPSRDEARGCALFCADEAHASVVFVSPRFAAVAPQLLEKYSAVECAAPPQRAEGAESGTALLLASDGPFAWSLLG